VDRRWFNHLFVELSVALGEVAPRYALWLRIGEHGFDPAKLERHQVMSFCDQQLPVFLADHSLGLSPRAHRKMLRSLRRFDPRAQSPEEHLARMVSPRGS
jgi:hypothetical protein